MDARLWAAGEDQAYNLSLGPSTHDLMVTVTSTRRGTITPGVIGEGPGLKGLSEILPTFETVLRAAQH